MRAIPDEQTPKQTPDKTEPESSPEEPPPTYSPPTESVGSGSSSQTPFKTKPTNFLLLSNDNNTIRGEFVVDPSLCIPPSMLPPLGQNESEDDRKNLHLSSKHSSVHADIWLLGSSGTDSKPRRTTLVLASGHGSIHAQVHTVNTTTPFALTATAPHGSVKLELPCSFTGLLCLSTRHGGITLSDAMLEHVTQLSQVGDMRRYFVGDFSLLGDAWEGDQVDADSTHGSVRVRYVDEREGQRQGKKGLFSRLFGS